jgi:uncharacterized protein YfdQ (DUF2303 family)
MAGIFSLIMTQMIIWDTGPNNVPANLDTDEFDLPLTFRIGLSMDLYESRFFRVTGAVDANTSLMIILSI